MKPHRVLLSLLPVAALLAAPRVARADTKLGYVDLQRALGEVSDGKSARAKLKKEFDLRQKQLDERQDEVKKMQADLQAKGDAMSEDARRAKQAEMNQKLQDVAQLYSQLQKELSQKEHDATKPIFIKMNTIVKAIAEAENVQMVFEKTDSGLFYAQPSLDLTNELIRRYNATGSSSASGSKDTTSPAAAAP